MNFLTGVIVGALLGASIALLTAPQKGARVRARLVERVRLPRDPSERELATRGARRSGRARR